ncbi:MAG: cysteine--tRNA ligase [Thermoprotei archaeon]
MVSDKPPIFLYNTLYRRVELLEPIYPGRVKMFVCGPTVQDYSHLGHGRTYVIYDVLARLLKYMGYRVNFIMNITDVDDKVVEAAGRTNSDFWVFVDQYTRAFIQDMKALGVISVRKYERASSYIQEMLYQISTLIEKGHAYVSDGDVYFDVSTYPYYGQLSKQSVDELMLRPIEMSSKKRSQVDFALWRAVHPNGGDPCWQSPWGKGRPGWHIEDTAITVSNFGPQYDIHGGGYELVYPHHEAEIAQAESFTGVRPFVKYWVHTGMLTIGGKKMSKSEGNLIYLKDAIRKYGANTLRWYFMSAHYRSDVSFDEGALESSAAEVEEIKYRASKIRERVRRRFKSDVSTEVGSSFRDVLTRDLDTPRALSSLKRLLADSSNQKPGLRLYQAYRVVLAAEEILGLGIDE